MMIPGLDLETSQAAIRLAEKYENIYAAVGFHPNEAYKWDETSAESIRQLSQHPKVLAIGEIGLDYYRNTTDKEVQIEVLQQQLQLAAGMDLPVIIHNRKASDDLYPILLDWQKGMATSTKNHAKQAGVLHAFNEDHPLLEKLVEANFYFGMGGPITYANNKNTSLLVTSIPINRLLLETDAPFLPPHPYRGQRNEPAYTQLIAAKVATLFSKKVDEIAEITFSNTTRLFSWRREQ